MEEQWEPKPTTAGWSAKTVKSGGGKSTANTDTAKPKTDPAKPKTDPAKPKTGSNAPPAEPATPTVRNGGSKSTGPGK